MAWERERYATERPVELDFIHADADYFRTKARQCFRMARRTHDKSTATTLRSLAETFETKARTLDDRG
jgi:hypothetical protein